MSALNVGLGNGASYSALKPGKSNSPTTWTLVCNIFFAGQMIGGVVVCILSVLYLFEALYWSGLLVGGLLIVVGAVGFLGTYLAHRDLLNFHLVGAILGIIVSFQFVGQMWREVDVDCALAELYVKSNVLEDMSRTFAQHDMFDSVYKRMNEMEDMLDVMHYGLGRTVDYLKDKPKQDGFDFEKHYLRTKLEVLRQHAEKILKDIEDNPNITSETVTTWSKDEKNLLDKKMEAAENVLERIDVHFQNEKDGHIRPEEYEKLLNDIIEAVNIPSIPGRDWQHDPKDLHDLQNELPETMDIIKTLTSELSELDKLANDHEQLGESTHTRMETYRKEFMDLMENSKKERERSHHEDILQQMPEHCVEETKAFSYMGFVGIAVALFQLATIYSTLCVSFRLPMKNE